MKTFTHHGLFGGGVGGTSGGWGVAVGSAIRPPQGGSGEGKFTRQSVFVKSLCFKSDATYSWPVPRLWNDTIESHRREVHDAILRTTLELVEEQGLLSVTMSQIASETGIGRATLYKYFPDVESILRAWHEQKISDHMGSLAEARDRAATPEERLEAVLHAYAFISHGSRGHHDSELAALLHRDEHVVVAEQHLRDLITGLIADAARAGSIRDDVHPRELASYCLHALTAAGAAPSKTAVRRLVTLTLAGLRRDG